MPMNLALQDRDNADNVYRDAPIEAEIAEVRRTLLAAASRPSLEFCEDCDDTIPQKRRELVPGCTRCVECAEVHARISPQRRGMTLDPGVP